MTFPLCHAVQVFLPWRDGAGAFLFVVKKMDIEEIRQLVKEQLEVHEVSYRELEKLSGVNRSIISRFLAGSDIMLSNALLLLDPLCVSVSLRSSVVKKKKGVDNSVG